MSDTLSENYSKLNKRYQEIKNQLADLETKLAESEKSKESYRIQNEHHHLQLLQFYSRLGVEAFGADIHEKALETLMIMKEQLAKKEKEIESLKVDCVLNEELEEKDYTIIKPFLKETLTIEEIKHIIKNLSDFNLRQTSFHDIQKNDVIFNAYINKHIAYKKCLDLLDFVDQDKISFAVEQLEQIRKEFEIKFKGCKWEDKMLVGKFCNITNEIIDNTINELKKVK